MLYIYKGEYLFKNRHEAGMLLSKMLTKYKDTGAVVLGIPRGGVVIAYEIANAINAELDVIVPRKIGARLQPELAIGAIAEDGTSYIDYRIAAATGSYEEYIRKETEIQKKEIRRRVLKYRDGRNPTGIKGRTVIIADDGIATGYTMIAACRFARKSNPRKILIAVPVAPPDVMERLKAEADEIICLETPEPFFAIGQFYEQFEQVGDDEVTSILRDRQAKSPSN